MAEKSFTTQLKPGQLIFNNIEFIDQTLAKPRIDGDKVNFKGNYITLNNHVPLLKDDLEAGLKIDRIDKSDVSIRWSESNKNWELTENGTFFFRVWHQGNVRGIANRVLKWKSVNKLNLDEGVSDEFDNSIIEDTRDGVSIDGHVESGYKLSVEGNALVKGNVEIRSIADLASKTYEPSNLLVKKMALSPDIRPEDVPSDLGGHLTVEGNTLIHGSLEVKGETITFKSEVVKIADNIIDLNSNFTSGTPSEPAGIQITRGSENNTTFRWNEDLDLWDLTENGTDFHKLWHQGNFDWDSRLNYLPKWINCEKEGETRLNKLTPSLIVDDGETVTIEGNIKIIKALEIGNTLTLNLYDNMARIIVNRDINSTSEFRWDEVKGQFEIAEDGSTFKKVWHQGNLLGTRNMVAKWTEDNLLGTGTIEDSDAKVFINNDLEIGAKHSLILNYDDDNEAKIKVFDVSTFPMLLWSGVKKDWEVTIKNDGERFNIWHRGNINFLPENNIVPRWDSSRSVFDLKKGSILDSGERVSIGSDLDENYRFKVGGDVRVDGFIELDKNLDIHATKDASNFAEARISINMNDGAIRKPSIRYIYDKLNTQSRWELTTDGTNFHEVWDKHNIYFKKGFMFVLV